MENCLIYSESEYKSNLSKIEVTKMMQIICQIPYKHAYTKVDKQ